MAMRLDSVIIATFNSARTLSLVLASIRKQTYSQKDIEILIVDGGSADATLSIAKKFHCNVVLSKNSKVVIRHFLENYKKYKRPAVRASKKPSEIIADYLFNIA